MGKLIQFIFYVIISTVLAAALAFAVIYVQGQPVEAARQAAQKLLGANAGACDGIKAVARKVAPLFTGKVVILNQQTKALDTALQDALPAALRAVDGAEVGLILCIMPVTNEYNTDYYGATKKYKCVQYTRDFRISAVDPVTQKVIASDLIDGGAPTDCPDKTDSDLTRYGDPPTASDIVTWLKAGGWKEKGT